MLGREADAAWVGRDVIDADTLAVLDAEAEQAQSTRRVPDGRPSLLAQAAGDEALHGAAVIRDAESGVAGTDEWTHAVDDDLQDALEAELLGDRDGGSVERLEASPGLLCGGRPSFRFADRSGELLRAGGGFGRVAGDGGSIHPVQSTSPDMTNGPLMVS